MNGESQRHRAALSDTDAEAQTCKGRSIAMMGLFGYGFGPGAGFFGASAVGMLLMALLWIGLIALALWAIRHLFPRERRTERDVAREVIGRRYAAGQITEAEYRQAMRALGVE